MSWLALDARCRAAERAGWERWEHTRFQVAAWTGQKVKQVLPLPTDGQANTAKKEPPSVDWAERLREKAEKAPVPTKEYIP